MVKSNAHADDDSIEHMMGDYSHVGDESIQDVDEDAINLDNIDDLLQGPNHRNAENHQAIESHQRDSTTDQQLIDSFPYVYTNNQETHENPHIDDDTNRFLKPFGTNQKDEDSFSAVMKHWKEEREAQERQKNESTSSAQEEINNERKKVGLYHNVPGDFAETLIFYDPFTFNTIVDEFMDTILSNVDNRSVDEWLEILKRFNEYHKDDGHIPRSHRVFLKKLEDGPFDYMTQSDWELLVKVEGFMYYEWSVYPDVRSVTLPMNEENDERYETFRVYVIGICWGFAGIVLYSVFEVRDAIASVDPNAFEMLVALTGQLWALLPRISIPLFRGKRLVFNSGLPWSYREQMLATVTATVPYSNPLAQDAIIALSSKYIVGQRGADNFGFIILLILSTRFVGFAIAGLQRAFLVYPSKMVFFDSLYVNSMGRDLVAMEPRTKVNGWVLKRWEFFYLFTVLFFGWYWLVNLAFEALSDFDWPTWIAPDNVNLNAITGTHSGLGFFPISTFDTTVISFTSLFTPWNALWQYTAGFLVATLAAIIIWFTNTANTGYLPINMYGMFDNTGNQYNTSRIVNSNHTFNQKEYNNYSMVYYTATGLVGRGVLFMYYPAQLVSCILHYWYDFFRSCQSLIHYHKNPNVFDGFDDRFSRTARSYPEAPEWWFVLILLVCFGVAIAVVEHWGFVQTPVYSLVLSFGIAIIFIYPRETFRARTAYDFEIGGLLNLINGMIFKGNPTGFMISTLYGNALSNQNDNYIDNLKIGHYAGIAPRSLFRTQALSLLLSSILDAGLTQSQASGKFSPDICNPNLENYSNFNCYYPRRKYLEASFLTAVSSKRIFRDYKYLKWTFLIGALYPLLLWIIRQVVFRMKSRRPFSKIIESDILVVLDEMLWLNAGVSLSLHNTWQFVGSNFVIGVLWHKWIKPIYPQWYAKYTYLFFNTTSVAYAFNQFVQIIAIDKIRSLDLSWWGNDVNSKTLDKKNTAVRLRIPEKGYFGPNKGNFPI